MRLVRRIPKGLLGALVLIVLVGPVSVQGQASAVKRDAEYDSRYLVFGTQDATNTPRIVAIDVNRIRRGADRVTYEYKVFAAVGGDWTLHAYEKWDVDPDTTPLFPARKGVRPALDTDQSFRVEVDRADLALQVEMEAPTFAFSSSDSRFGIVRTARPRLTVTWNGTVHDLVQMLW